MFRHFEKFLQIFYHKNHRSFTFCDCYGICYLFNKEVLGINLPEFLDEDIWDDDGVDLTIKKNRSKFKKIKLGKEKAGDIVSFKINGQFLHVGVVLQLGQMLHIMEEKHAVIESYHNLKWKEKVDSFWRYENTI